MLKISVSESGREPIDTIRTQHPTPEKEKLEPTLVRKMQRHVEEAPGLYRFGWDDDATIVTTRTVVSAYLAGHKHKYFDTHYMPTDIVPSAFNYISQYKKAGPTIDYENVIGLLACLVAGDTEMSINDFLRVEAKASSVSLSDTAAFIQVVIADRFDDRILDNNGVSKFSRIVVSDKLLYDSAEAFSKEIVADTSLRGIKARVFLRYWANNVLLADEPKYKPTPTILKDVIEHMESPTSIYDYAEELYLLSVIMKHRDVWMDTGSDFKLDTSTLPEVREYQ